MNRFTGELPIQPLVTHRITGADVTAPVAIANTLVEIVQEFGTLYDWAAGQPQPRALRGRAPVYVAALPNVKETVVVRHAWHGGLLAPITSDRFVRPTRAPLEQHMSARLRDAGIPTTVVLGYARYDIFSELCRVDVVSRFIPDAFDLGMIAAGLVPDVARDEALRATSALLVRLAAHGVIHPDLNVKNVLLVREGVALKALMIDVDVVRWDPSRSPQETMQANVARLTRSMRKWRTHFGCDVTDTMLEHFARDAMASVPPRAPSVIHD